MKFLFSSIFCGLCLTLNAAPRTVTLSGHVDNYPAKKIYLLDAYSHEPKDSANVRDGSFKFIIALEKAESPDISLSMTKDYDSQKVLMFKNLVLSTEKKTYGNSLLILDADVIKISGDYNNLHHVLTATAGPDNLLAMRYQMEDFGDLRGLNSAQKEITLNEIKDVIKKNPDSHYLLFKIYQSKERYSKDEITAVISLFNKETEGTDVGQKFKVYLDNRPHEGQKFDVKWALKNEKGKLTSVYDGKKLNMIVFWASWCGPCRIEIPVLKKLDSLYSAKGLNIVSVSIDRNESDWQIALKKEKMRWGQFIVNKGSQNIVQAKYNFSSIPMAVIVDQNGRELYRESGFDIHLLSEYQKIIDKLIVSSN